MQLLKIINRYLKLSQAKELNCTLEENDSDYFKGLKFTFGSYKKRTTKSLTGTLHTQDSTHIHIHCADYTRTGSIVHRRTHRSPETAVTPSAIKQAD